MSEDLARVRMTRHQHLAKNRQQSMLTRSAEEIGLDGNECWKSSADQCASHGCQPYNSNGASMS